MSKSNQEIEAEEFAAELVEHFIKTFETYEHGVGFLFQLAMEVEMTQNRILKISIEEEVV